MSNRKRSMVWTYFDKADDETKSHAVCKFCGLWISHFNTSNLLKHLRCKHRDETAALGQIGADGFESQNDSRNFLDSDHHGIITIINRNQLLSESPEGGYADDQGEFRLSK